MTSLFSSFDFGIFGISTIFFLVLFTLGAGSILFLTNLNFYYVKTLEISMGSFFSSLNNSNFTKGFSKLIVLAMVFIFIMNISSIFPFTFPMTSQMSVVMGLSLSLWIPLMLMSFKNNFKSQLAHFIPEGSPLGISFGLFLVELVSNSIRPITLSVRLVANILAGHLLVTLLSLLVSSFPLSLVFLSGLNLVEMLVSLIQSYIFVTLVSLYYSEI